LYISLKKKIIILFTAICLLLSVLGIVWSSRSQHAIQENAIMFNEQIIKQLNGDLDAYIEEITNLTLPLIARPASAQFLEKSGDGPVELVMLRDLLYDNFSSVMFGRTDILGISMVSEGGIALSSYSNLFAQSRHAEISKKINRVGVFEIAGTYQYANSPILTMAVKFVGPNSLKPGLLIVDIRLTDLIRKFSTVKIGETGFAWIVDSSGQYLYYPDNNKWGKSIPASYREHLKQASAGSYLDEQTGRKMLVTYLRSNDTGLTVFAEVHLLELNRTLNGLLQITVIVGIIVIFTSLTAALSVSFSLSHSILDLQKAMKRVKNGNLKIRLTGKKRNEIGDLYRDFNSMVEEIESLIDEVNESHMNERELELKRKDAKLQAMHYQINPHFLYNTLEIISSYAIVEGSTEISRIVRSLAKIFRYSVGSHSKVVPLLAEIDNIEDYLSIQKERFETLTVEYSIDPEEVKHIPVVPLSIQPIVENAFKHGYQEHKLAPNLIRISGVRHVDHYQLMIEDEGKGMEADVFLYYRDLFEDLERQEPEGAEQLGLWNVHSRLRLTFGQPYGVKLIRSNKQGTVISIMLPLEIGLQDMEKGAGEYV
jgi:two-component system sensor histidine kinase YesM